MWDSRSHRLPSLRGDNKPWDDSSVRDASPAQLTSHQLPTALSQLLLPDGSTTLRAASADRFVIGQRGVVDVAFTYSGKLSARRSSSGDLEQADAALELIVEQQREALAPAAAARRRGGRGSSSEASQLEVIAASPHSDDDDAAPLRRPNARGGDGEVYLPPQLLEGMLVRPGPDWPHGNPAARGDGVVLKPFKNQLPGRTHVKWRDETTGVYRYDDTWRDLYAVREQDAPVAELQRRIRVLEEQLKSEQFRSSSLKGKGAEEGIRERLIRSGLPKEQVEPVTLTTLHDVFAHVGVSLSDKEVNEVAERLARRLLPVALAQHLEALKGRDDIMLDHGAHINAARSLMKRHGAKSSSAYELARNDSIMTALAKVRDELESAGAYEVKQKELRMVCDMVHVLESLASHVRTNKDPTALAQLGERGSRLGVTLATFLVRRAQGASYPLRGLPEMQLDGRGAAPTVVTTKQSAAGAAAGTAGSGTAATTIDKASLQDYIVTFSALEYKRSYGKMQMEVAVDQLEVSLPTCALLHHMGSFHVGFPKPHGRVTYELRGTVHFDVWRSSKELLKVTDRALELPWPERARDATAGAGAKLARAAASRSRSLADDDDVVGNALREDGWWSFHEGVSVHLRINPEEDWSADETAKAEVYADKRESREKMRAQRRAASAGARGTGSRPRSSRGDSSVARRAAARAGRSGSSASSGLIAALSAVSVGRATGGGSGRRSAKSASSASGRSSESGRGSGSSSR